MLTTAENHQQHRENGEHGSYLSQRFHPARSAGVVLIFCH
jgi:hypothetical protein